jgi:hypothetical protein
VAQRGEAEGQSGEEEEPAGPWWHLACGGAEAEGGACGAANAVGLIKSTGGRPPGKKSWAWAAPMAARKIEKKTCRHPGR